MISKRMSFFLFADNRNKSLEVLPDGRLMYVEDGVMTSICSYEWDDVDAGVACRYLGLGSSGRAKYLQRDLSFNRSQVFGIFCNGNEIDAFDCPTNENDTTNGQCAYMEDAGIECEGTMTHQTLTVNSATL